MKYANTSLLYFIITITVSFGALYYVNGEIKEFSKQSYYNSKIFSERVIVETPKTTETISSPVKIFGSVEGTGSFEDEVLGKIIDAGGTILGQGPLVATRDRMTTKGVRFEGIIPFSAPNSENGFVIIEGINKDGNTPPIKIPILFEVTSDTACMGDSCGECTIGSIGTGGFCVHDSATKNL